MVPRFVSCLIADRLTRFFIAALIIADLQVGYIRQSHRVHLRDTTGAEKKAGPPDGDHTRRLMLCSEYREAIFTTQRNIKKED